MELAKLKELLHDYKVELTDKMVQQFLEYQELLSEWNEKINLTALSKEEYIEKHFYDSLLLVKAFNFSNQKVMDVGTGAGFPGIPLKIVFPSLSLTLLEPTAKRCVFLTEVVNRLGLENVAIVNKRAEDLDVSYRNSFDVVAARAVAALNIILELTIPFVKKEGVFIALKGSSALDELEQSKHAIKALDVRVVKIDENRLPSEDAIRRNIVFLKEKETGSKYPRPYAQIKRKPL